MHRITTKTYQKPMNLFLYIPPHSAHPAGVLKSIIYGNLRRYWIQNSNHSDYISTVTRFAQHLVNRGHNRETIKTIFLDAAAHMDSQEKANRRDTPTASPPQEISSTLYIHWEYHPRGIQRHIICQMYNHALSCHSGFDQMIVAFNRPRNLGDLLMPTTMKEPPDRPVSSLFPPTNLKLNKSNRDPLSNTVAMTPIPVKICSGCSARLCRASQRPHKFLRFFRIRDF
jgi:hypothetical protein